MAKAAADPVMKRVALLFEKSGKTLESLGEAMGYAKDTARMSAWQFLNKTTDPRLSMLRKFARAVNVPLEELVKAGKPRKDSGPAG